MTIIKKLFLLDLKYVAENALVYLRFYSHHWHHWWKTFRAYTARIILIATNQLGLNLAESPHLGGIYAGLGVEILLGFSKKLGHRVG